MRIEILDSTLRDGAQAEGVSFSVNDKLDIVRSLDTFGVAIIEAGNPASNPKDLEFFERVRSVKLSNSVLSSFGSTRRKNTLIQDDAGCASLLKAGTPIVSVFGKTSQTQVKNILQTSMKENLKMIEETCRYLTDNGRRVIYDAEQFFDGYRENPDYALSALKAALSGGAYCLCLCDTNGGSFPTEVADVTRTVCGKFPDTVIGIHAHNDSDLATACSIAAVKAGASHVQGTLIGFGERCGNARLSSVIPNLQIKCGVECIPEDNLQLLTPTALKIASTANVTLHKNTPFVGRNSFAHKAGMHADAVLKLPSSYEHIEPSLIGNRRRILVSEFAGRAAVFKKVQRLYPELDKSSPVITEIVDSLKRKEYEGYQFEGAEASFDLIIRRMAEKYAPFFDLISYKVLDELPYDNNHSATATIKVRVNNTVKIAASDGEGPVNALDTALREALADFYPCLNAVKLVDYKVRVMEPKFATAAQVRVLITSSDSDEIWTTVGTSNDIIEASWIALVDSIEHKLIKNRE